MISGSPIFDGLVVFTVSADFTKPTLSLTARAAFVNSATGQTHGWTDGDGGMWSATTMRKLAELREALEEDLAARHLGGGSRATPATKTAATDAAPGIVEQLSTKERDNTPSV